MPEQAGGNDQRRRGIPAIYRVGELDQKPYIITEFVRGQTLDKLERPLPRDQLLAITVALARGLAAAHRRGVVHGDIKPGKAIQSEDGINKLLDFGLAAMVEDSGGFAGGTQPGATRGTTGISGTPDYMAPEIWLGEPADRRSDVYSLGAVIYEMATGHTPFHDIASLSDLMRVVQNRDAPSLSGAPGVDARLAAVVDRCLSRDPEKRFASADELRDALETLERVGTTAQMPGGNPYRGLRAFESDHRALFFGRDQEIGTVIDRLRAESFVLVTGGSGSGKS